MMRIVAAIASLFMVVGMCTYFGYQTQLFHYREGVCIFDGSMECDSGCIRECDVCILIHLPGSNATKIMIAPDYGSAALKLNTRRYVENDPSYGRKLRVGENITCSYYNTDISTLTIGRNAPGLLLYLSVWSVVLGIHVLIAGLVYNRRRTTSGIV